MPEPAPLSTCETATGAMTAGMRTKPELPGTTAVTAAAAGSMVARRETWSWIATWKRLTAMSM